PSGRAEGIEPALDAAHVLAGPVQRVLAQLRARALADDVVDAEALAEVEAAVADRELQPVERAHGRTGGAVALGVVLAAVARAAEAGGLDRHEAHLGALRVLDRLLLAERPVRLHRAAE